MTPLKFCNKLGFPCLENVSAALSTTAEVFTFNPHPFRNHNFSGGLFVKIHGTATAPTTAVPIQFATEGVPGSNIAVAGTDGEALTTATWPGNGVYLMFFDKDENKLMLLF